MNATTSLPRSPMLSVVFEGRARHDGLGSLLDALVKAQAEMPVFEAVVVVDENNFFHQEEIWRTRGEGLPMRLVSTDQVPSDSLSHAFVGARGASGTWVTAAVGGYEPAADYYAEIARALPQINSENMLVTRRVELDAAGVIVENVIEGRKFERATQGIVDLLKAPEALHLSAETSVWRRDKLLSLAGTLSNDSDNYSSRVRLTSEYLAANGERFVVAPAATLSFTRKTKHMVREYHGGIDLAALSEVVVGSYAPLSRQLGRMESSWFANVLLLTISHIFADNRRLHSEVYAMPGELLRLLRESVRELMAFIGESAIRNYRITKVPAETRAAWLAILGSLTSSPVVLQETDAVQQRLRVAFYSDSLEVPFAVEGLKQGQLLGTKARSVEYLGEHWLYEHVVVAAIKSSSNVRFKSGTDDFVLEYGGQVQHGSKKTGVPSKVVGWNRIRLALAFRVAKFSRYARRFTDAWVLVDRREQANDNAEVLYRHLLNERPNINAWFVLSNHAPGYRDLKKEGFRMVPYGSLRHFVLMKHAKHLISSQIDVTTMQPFPTSVLARSWIFTYLKHGVLHTAHFRRYNSKRINLIITATPDEDLALTRNGGGYRFLRNEVKLAGMPRHDRLARVNAAMLAAGEEPNLLLIMPTWRIYLGRKNRDLTWSVIDEFEESEFVQKWSAVLSDPRLREVCDEAGLKAVFLMHPRFAPHAHYFDIPDWMATSTYQDDIASLIAATKLAVTDYSSQAFEAAFVGAPTVYFQFDREEFFSGGHSSQAGDYDYKSEGFGPVEEEPRGTVEAIAAMTAGSHPKLSEYVSRITHCYAFHDDRASERVVAELESRWG